MGTSVRVVRSGVVDGGPGDAGAIIGATALDRSVVGTAATLVSRTDPDRVLPVADPLAEVLPAGGLVRGQVIACLGSSAPVLALALLARASATGSWLAVVGVPWLGAEAAREVGVSLERMLAIDIDPRRHDAWAEALVAAADGVELLLTARDAGLPDRVLRRVRTRVRARGAVLVTLPAGAGAVGGGSRWDEWAGDRTGDGAAGVDLVLTAHTDAWWGLGRGHGRVGGRRLRVEVTGRRMPRPVESSFELRGGALVG